MKLRGQTLTLEFRFQAWKNLLEEEAVIEAKQQMTGSAVPQTGAQQKRLGLKGRSWKVGVAHEPRDPEAQKLVMRVCYVGATISCVKAVVPDIRL